MIRKPSRFPVALLIGLLSAPVALHAQQAADSATSAGAMAATGAGPSGLQPPALPEGSDHVRVEALDDPEVVDFVIGPVSLAAGMMHYRLPIQMAEMPITGWLHGFSVQMEDADGNEIPVDLLHHVNFIDPDARDLFSPIARRVMAAGRETSRQSLPWFLGYPVEAGDRMLIAAMFANPTGTDYPEAYVHVRFRYSREGEGWFEPRDVFPFYLDVMGPVGVKDFAVPPGHTVKSWEGRPAVDGRILGIGGHLHDYATRLRLVDVTSGKTVWETAPEVNASGRVTGVPSRTFIWRLGKKIYADHTYRIEVEYDNPTDQPARDGGMGAIGGVVWVGKDANWPAFDRNDPAYVDDLAQTLTAPERLAGHSHGAMEGMDHGSGAMEGTDHEGATMEGMDHGDAPHSHGQDGG